MEVAAQLPEGSVRAMDELSSVTESVAADHHYTSGYEKIAVLPKSQVDGEKSESSDGEIPEGVYEVDSIVSYKKDRGIEYFKVRWLNYGPADDTWEPRDSLCETPSVKRMVEEFLYERESKRKNRKFGAWGNNWEYIPENKILNDDAKFYKKLEKGHLDVAIEIASQKRKSAPKFNMSEDNLGLASILETSPPEKSVEGGCQTQSGGESSRSLKERKRGRPKKFLFAKVDSPTKFSFQKKPHTGLKVVRGRNGTLTKAEQKERMRMKLAKLSSVSKSQRENGQPGTSNSTVVAPAKSLADDPVKENSDLILFDSGKISRTTEYNKTVMEKIASEEGSTAMLVASKLLTDATQRFQTTRRDVGQRQSAIAAQMDSKGNMNWTQVDNELDEDPGRELAAFQSKLKLQQAMNAKLLKAVKDMKLNDVKMYVRTSSAGIIPDIDQTDSIGVTLLMLVSQENCDHLEHNVCTIADVLIKHGASINATTYLNETALTMALSKNNLCLVKHLLKHNAFVNIVTETKPTKTALYSACHSAAHSVVELLIHNGADLGFVSSEKMTPLQLSVKRKRTHTTQMLVKYEQMQSEAMLKFVQSVMINVGEVKMPVFPVRTVVLRETRVIELSFFCEKRPQESQLRAILFCPFVHYHKDPELTMTCRWTGKCPITSVVLNGVTQRSSGGEMLFSTSFHPLVIGKNHIKIRLLEETKFYDAAKMFIQAFYVKL